MKNIIFKSISALVLIGASTGALAASTYVTCYYNDDKDWKWGLDDSGEYQKITGNWQTLKNTNVEQFHVIEAWTQERITNVCKKTLEQNGIKSKITNIYAANSNFGSNYPIVYKNLPKPVAKPELSLGGQWKSIQKCTGSNCESLQVSYTVGVEQGKAIEKSSSIGMALSVSLGMEAEAPGFGKVTSEFTSELSTQHTQSIMNSFTHSEAQTMQYTCKAPGEIWQWVSTATIKNGTQPKVITAKSNLVACTAPGQEPQGKNLRNPAWSPV